MFFVTVVRENWRLNRANEENHLYERSAGCDRTLLASGAQLEISCFAAGQIPLDPKSGQIVPGDISTQTRRVLDNIRAVLKAEGLTFEKS